MENISQPLNTQEIPVQQSTIEPKEPNKSKYVPVIILLIVLLIIAVLVAGYFAYQSAQLRNRVSNGQTSVTPSIQPISASPKPSSVPNYNETDNWKTYSNNKYKYEFKFPPLWEYNRGPGNLSDAELSNQRDIDLYMPNLPSGNPGTGFTVKVNELDAQGNTKNCTTLEDCIEKSFSWLPKTQETENGVTTFLGQEAKTVKYTRVTPLYSQTWKYVFVILNNNFYSISLSSETGDFNKNLTTFDQILSTFKLTK